MQISDSRLRMKKPEANDSGVISAAMHRWFGADDFGQIQMGHGFATTAERSLKAHEHVFLEGESQTYVYQVLEGVIGVYKLLPDGRRQIVAFHYPGDMIGLDHHQHFADHAEALCDARIRCIPADTVDSLISNEPGFGQALMRLLAIELAETREQLLSLGRKSAMEKLATFLLRISRRNESFGLNSELLHVPMTRAEMADYLGLTVETVSRNITKLKVARVIQLNSRSKIKVLDPDALQKIANAGF